MLSAFTARPIVELKTRDKSKVESVLSHGDRLFVGLNTGNLRVYRVNEGSNASDRAVDLLREEEKFSKYKIEQLAVIKEAATLISLSNGLISTHDLSTYELHSTLQKTKGATTFAVTSNIVNDQGIPLIVSRLAVAVKRRLLLWIWQDSDLVSEAQEITLVTGIKTLTWATATRLVTGLTASYVLVDVENSSVTDIVGPGSIGGGSAQDAGRFSGAGVASLGYMGMGGMVPKPLATRLKDGELLLAKDINTHFIDSDGKALGRRQIPWSIAPEAIGYSYPFLLSLNATKGALEVRNPETLTQLQSISLANSTQFYVPNPNVSLAHAGKGFFVAGERCIWRMDALGYDEQINALIDERRYDEAISLLGMLEDALLKDKEGRLREAELLKAQELFDLRKYRDSMDLFTKARAPPERAISLYPQAISGDLHGKSESSEVDQEKSSASVETPDEQEAPKIATDKNDVQERRNSAKDQEATETSKPKASTQAPEMSDAASQRSVSISEAIQSRRDLEGKDLQVATSELCSFLVSARTKLQRFLNFDGTMKQESTVISNGSEGQINAEDLLLSPEESRDHSLQERLQATAKLVDTTLFRAYMLARPSMAGPLFRLPNFCDPLVVKEKLEQSKRYNDLIDFLYGKRLHREALQLLQSLGKEDSKVDRPDHLKGPERTVAYLQNLDPTYTDLIFEFVRWPLSEDPKLGMEVFITDSDNAESLSRDRVLSFLKEIDEQLAVKYLEHIINELNDVTPGFHKELIEEYLRQLKAANKDSKPKVQQTLLTFLKSSKHYQSWKILPLLQRHDPDVYEARAIILGNMGEHRQALSIYVFDLQDSSKAEEYCNQVFVDNVSSPTSPSFNVRRVSTSTDDITPSIYNVLLSLYLSPPSPHKMQWDPALDLLAKHGSRLPASSTLELIPEVLSVEKLQSYFTGRMRAANTIVNEVRIVAALRRTLDDSEEARLRLGESFPGGNRGRNRSVSITEERVCGVCHKRFGGSAIKVLPNNSVVHYGCAVG